MKKSLAVVVLSLASSFNALADGSKVQLGSYCPVAYVGANKALPGSLQFTSEVDGKVYAFINEGAKKAFDAEPQKFTKAIQYEAWCATGPRRRATSSCFSPEVCTGGSRQRTRRCRSVRPLQPNSFAKPPLETRF